MSLWAGGAGTRRCHETTPRLIPPAPTGSRRDRSTRQKVPTGPRACDDRPLARASAAAWYSAARFSPGDANVESTASNFSRCPRKRVADCKHGFGNPLGHHGQWKGFAAQEPAVGTLTLKPVTPTAVRRDRRKAEAVRIRFPPPRWVEIDRTRTHSTPRTSQYSAAAVSCAHGCAIDEIATSSGA